MRSKYTARIWGALFVVAIATLSSTSCLNYEHPKERGDRSWADVEPLVAMEEGPEYHLLEGYDERWLRQVEEGVEQARSYWGSYGPAHVWVLGCEDGDSISEEAKQSFLSEYCAWRTATSERTVSECLPYAEERFIDVAESGEPEAYLSDVRDTEQRMGELIFINVHKWYYEDDVVPDPVLRGMHEYTHIFQSAFGVMPTWMMEGGAVFSEAWIPYKSGRRDIEMVMGHCMESAHRALRRGRSIAEMEAVETAPGKIVRYHRELAYDAGAWATAFMIHESETQSVSSLRDELYPSVTKLGWERALSEYVGVESKEEFYEDFSAFMAAPRHEQLELLGRLRD